MIFLVAFLMIVVLILTFFLHETRQHIIEQGKDQIAINAEQMKINKLTLESLNLKADK